MAPTGAEWGLCSVGESLVANCHAMTRGRPVEKQPATRIRKRALRNRRVLGQYVCRIKTCETYARQCARFVTY
jgi:hypothetical protein